MRISDWSSDVCSSDLLAIRTGTLADARLIRTRIASRQFLTCAAPGYLDRTAPLDAVQDLDRHEHIVGTSTTWKFKQGDRQVLYKPSGRFRCNSGHEIGRASCRERVCQYV